ncbi:glutathione synthase, ribosomal protein S6 modification protein [Legionella quinlivanii]|uniref:Probable alpha-L-glutamate ligase n=1 Tax=Legionella quinlivanii TaxID=45073 RepID=A0A0W0XLR0_9GAMM|nr:30S ribosomal protein S6--L-glutamate ligase [Legionella quinlivanii]KTD45411.1 glutathione synthase, ribosomal protein S6 modification protein [Legionella quinlivanii]MCW8451301.1 30S ribosomal protein S6--L-glutamate ligase [Legionella quinlivanii]RAP35918.1 ribosomal protein S6 modification protein [Legionella quinlivanii]SEG34274.1 ribosomal protein S6--L-glutamate ligase [Legionella quinlivanii DSM 21216]STY10502.1 ribosomal protein S6 modification protein [Legionella quinlivanii]
MKIAILATNPHLYSHQRLKEAGEAAGHEVNIINPLYCYMNVAASSPKVHYRGGEPLPKYDAVIPRIGASITYYGTAVLRHMETMGMYTLNESIAISRSRDKFRSLQILARKGIPMPLTSFAQSPDDTEDLIRMVGGAPLVIKLLEGTQGKGVILADSHQSAVSIINAFKEMSANILVQEFIQESKGTDIRCFVIGDKVVAAVKRQAKEGEFRANVHQGGKAQKVALSPQERAIAIGAAKAMGLKVAGVDLIRSNHGPLVLEINSSPGLEGVEKATHINIAGKIIQYIEKNAKPKGLNQRFQG